MSSGGALSGRTTRGGCGSNVIAIGVPPCFGGAASDALDDLEMPAVEAVEIAEGQHRMHQPRRPRVVREVDGFHSLHVDAHVEHQPIICQFDAGRQARRGRGVTQIVGHVWSRRGGA